MWKQAISGLTTIVMLSLPLANAQDTNTSVEMLAVDVCYNEKEIPKMFRSSYEDAFEITRNVFADANIQINYDQGPKEDCININFTSRIEDYNNILGQDYLFMPDIEEDSLKDLVVSLENIQNEKKKEFKDKKGDEPVLKNFRTKRQKDDYLYRAIGYAYVEEKKIMIRPYGLFTAAYNRVRNNFTLENEKDMNLFHKYFLAETINHEIGHVLGLVHVNNWLEFDKDALGCLLPHGGYSEVDGNLMTHYGVKTTNDFGVPDIRFSNVQKKIMREVIKNPNLRNTFFNYQNKKILNKEEIKLVSKLIRIGKCEYAGILNN